MPETTTHPFELTWPDEPGRIVRGRAVLPAEGESAGARPFVLVLHGFKGFMDWGFFPLLARRLAEAGIAAVAFNTSSSGIGANLQDFTELDAFERDTFSRQLEDIARVRDHVDAGAIPGVDPSRAGLFGHSRGGGMGLIHAAERGDYRAVVTWAAIDRANRYDDQTIALWRRTGRLPVVNARTGQTLYLGVGALEDYEAHRDRLDIRAACGRLRAPTLLVHGSADEAVPAAAVDALARAFPADVARVRVVAGAGHTFGARHPLAEVPPDLEGVLTETVQWFRARLA